MKLLYKHWKIKKQPIAFTPVFNYNWQGTEKKFKYSMADKYEKIRYFEISKYLEEHPEITHYVVVDDLILNKILHTRYSEEPIERDWGFHNFVHTIESEGLKQTGIKNKIIKYLKDDI